MLTFKKTFFNLFVFFILINTKNLSAQSSYPYRIINVDCVSKSNDRVISSKEEFKKVCDVFKSQSINFNTEILVNLSYSYGGCSKPNTHIEVTKNDKTKTINCRLFVENTGICRINFGYRKWIVIRKPVGDYKIEVGMVRY